MFLQRAIRGTARAVQTARHAWRREGDLLKFKDELRVARAYSTPRKDFLAFLRRIFEAEADGIRSWIKTKFNHAFDIYGLHIVVTSAPPDLYLFQICGDRVIRISASATPEDIRRCPFFRDLQILS